MRLKLMLCGVTALVPALLLTGCGVDQMSSPTPMVDSPAIAGQTFGGQQPVAHATIAVVAMGTSGYGSQATVLDSTTTDGAGNFSFAPGAYSCPQSNTPVYLLGIGGDSGAGTNNSAVLGAALGTCASAQKSFVILNEVTTAALAFSLSHFFSTTPTTGTVATPDSFGGPSTTSGTTVNYSTGLQMANNVTAPTIVFNAVGAPNQTTQSGVVEYQKIYTIANILANCVNTSGSTAASAPCGKLFADTQNGAATAPTDTLQAAVQMALNPTSNVTKLFALVPTTPAFTGGMVSAPHDWSIGLSFTSSAVGLAVNTGTLSTLDIDSSGRIWFPSNASGKVGVVYFDPPSQSFNGPYNTTSIVFPQQVAIDANGRIWANDSGSDALSGYLTTSPTTTPETVSLPNTISTSVTVGGDNRINVGVTSGARFELGNISASRSGYSILSGVSFIYPTQSIAGDFNAGDAVAATDTTTTTTRNYYVTTGGVLADVVNTNQGAGQAVYTGNDDVAVRSWTGAGTGANDGLCIYSVPKCYAFKGALEIGGEGMAIDGGKQLWVATRGNAGLLGVPVNNPAGVDGLIYVDATTGNIPVVELEHGGGQGAGATGTATTPYGVGVDAAGNVWMTNAGCTVTNCPPGSFTLTEIVGAAYPTITPVSAQYQITTGNLVGTEPTQ